MLDNDCGRSRGHRAQQSKHNAQAIHIPCLCGFRKEWIRGWWWSRIIVIEENTDEETKSYDATRDQNAGGGTGVEENVGERHGGGKDETSSNLIK